MKGFAYLSGVVTLQLYHERCIGCGWCEQVCPHQVFVLRDGKASIQSRDNCIECGACAMNCPVTAISVEAGAGCAAGIINEWLVELRIRKTGNGCC
jgi:ferredoxin